MHLQRMILPDGRVTWTAYEGDKIITEIRDFAIYLEARHYAYKTVASYVRHAVRLGNYLQGFGKNFQQITPQDFDRFLLAVSNGSVTSTYSRTLNIIALPYSKKEISRDLNNQILYAIKAFYGHLNVQATTFLFGKDQKDIPYRPDSFQPFLAHIEARRPRRRTERRSSPHGTSNTSTRAVTRRLSPEQVLKIVISAAKMRDAFLVVLLYTTGMRIGEARGLLHEDIDLKENIIWVRPRTLENGATVKSRRSRPIPVPDFVVKMYVDFVCSDEYQAAFETGTIFVFSNIAGGRVGRGLTENNASDIQRRLARNSAVYFTWHMFRHTHASEAIGQGYNLLEVADRLGHASPQTTNLIYKHLLSAEMRKNTLRGQGSLESGLADLMSVGFSRRRAKWL